VKGLVADVNIEGHVRALHAVFQTEAWQEFWAPLNLVVRTLAEIGLNRESSDLTVWQTCQREQLILVTANRNAEGADSLEAVIRAYNQPDSLPVFTVASADRILHERSYAERTAIRILDFLSEIDRYRGAGRLYVP
jgi:hypothetical protein